MFADDTLVLEIGFIAAENYVWFIGIRVGLHVYIDVYVNIHVNSMEKKVLDYFVQNNKEIYHRIM